MRTRSAEIMTQMAAHTFSIHGPLATQSKIKTAEAMTKCTHDTSHIMQEGERFMQSNAICPVAVCANEQQNVCQMHSLQSGKGEEAAWEGGRGGGEGGQDRGGGMARQQMLTWKMRVLSSILKESHLLSLLELGRLRVPLGEAGGDLNAAYMHSNTKYHTSNSCSRSMTHSSRHAGSAQLYNMLCKT